MQIQPSSFSSTKEINGSNNNFITDKNSAKIKSLFDRILQFNKNGNELIFTEDFTQEEYQCIHIVDPKIVSQDNFPDFTQEQRDTLITFCKNMKEKNITKVIEGYSNKIGNNAADETITKIRGDIALSEETFNEIKAKDQLPLLLKCCPDLKISINLKSNTQSDNDFSSYSIPAKIIAESGYFQDLLKNANKMATNITYEEDKKSFSISVAYSSKEDKENKLVFFRFLNNLCAQLKIDRVADTDRFDRKDYLKFFASNKYGLKQFDIIMSQNDFFRIIKSQSSIFNHIGNIAENLLNCQWNKDELGSAINYFKEVYLNEDDKKTIFNTFESIVSENKKYLLSNLNRAYDFFLPPSLIDQVLDKAELSNKLDKIANIDKYAKENRGTFKATIASYAFLSQYHKLATNLNEMRKYVEEYLKGGDSYNFILLFQFAQKHIPDFFTNQAIISMCIKELKNSQDQDIKRNLIRTIQDFSGKLIEEVKNSQDQLRKSELITTIEDFSKKLIEELKNQQSEWNIDRLSILIKDFSKELDDINKKKIDADLKVVLRETMNQLANRSSTNNVIEEEDPINQELSKNKIKKGETSESKKNQPVTLFSKVKKWTFTIFSSLFSKIKNLFIKKEMPK